MSITSIITDITVTIGGVAAVIYGLFRWRKYNQVDELVWCGYGIFVLVVMAWVFISHLYLPDTGLIGWSRPILMLLMVGFAVPIYIWHERKLY
jgi:succinate-acetate transporter protein